MKKICRRCQTEKPIEEFRKRGKKSGVQPYCKPCQKEYDRTYWQKTRAARLVHRPENDRKVRTRNTKYVWEYLKNHPCVECGESDPIVLEFDHLREKTKSVSDFVKQRASIKRIREEIDKCEVRCANCHRRKTAKDLNWYAALHTEFTVPHSTVGPKI